MSEIITFKLKNKSEDNINLVNIILKSKFNQALFFNSRAENQAWLDDINNNPNSQQRHLKPENGNLSMDDFLRRFEYFTGVGVARIDVAYGRTPKEELEQIVYFLIEFEELISSVDKIDELVSRSGLSEIKLLKKDLNSLIESFTTDCDMDEQVDDVEEEFYDIDTGIKKLNLFSKNKINFKHISCEKPVLKKRKVFVNEDINPIHRNKFGEALIYIPLVEDIKSHTDIYAIYEQCVSLGVHESICSFAFKAYPEKFNPDSVSFLSAYEGWDVILYLSEYRKTIDDVELLKIIDKNIYLINVWVVEKQLPRY